MQERRRKLCHPPFHPVNSWWMIKLAYLFERFPSFTQTFCYREVMELGRQQSAPMIFSIRRPEGEPSGNWDPALVRQVFYLPEEKELVREVEHAIRRRRIPNEGAKAIADWGRQTDFLRLYQAAYVGMQLPAGIHLHAHFAGMAARTAYWIKQFFHIPFSFTAHANDIFAPRSFAIGLDRLIDAASAIITESDYAANYLRERFPESSSKIQRVYNGLDPSSFPRAKFTAPVPLILSVGRLVEKKGFADLIEACRLLAGSGRKFHCEIIGEGPLRNDLQARIARNELQTHVTLSGAQAQEKIRQRLGEANVFVLPCTRETSGGTDNLPTVIAEAMAAGLPVVSTPIAGIPEMVEHDVTGELVPPNEPQALAGAIERFITDLPRSRQFGARGLELAREKFSIETSVKLLLNTFQQSHE
jgi:colanic acid/amylovoran biosynthesis glycosyltransferase